HGVADQRSRGGGGGGGGFRGQGARGGCISGHGLTPWCRARLSAPVRGPQRSDTSVRRGPPARVLTLNQCPASAPNGRAATAPSGRPACQLTAGERPLPDLVDPRLDLLGRGLRE